MYERSTLAASEAAAARVAAGLSALYVSKCSGMRSLSSRAKVTQVEMGTTCTLTLTGVAFSGLPAACLRASASICHARFRRLALVSWRGVGGDG